MSLTPRPQTRIRIGSVCWHRFDGQGILHVAYHCRRDLEFGFYHVRKSLRDRSAFDYDPIMGWEYDRWFEWPNENKQP